jgi:hypothetical protein
MFNTLWGVIACFVLATTLTACPPVTPPTTGSLTVTISGAPSGTTPSITVTGPNSFSSIITATTTIPDLVAGQYTIQANTLTSSDLEYAGAITGSPASVSAGATASASVTYAKSAMLISSLADSGAGSLRDMISSVDAGETLKFAAGTTGTITLTSELALTKNVTLEGTGVTLSGGNTNRVLNIAAGSSITVKSLKLVNGKSIVAPASSKVQPRAAIAGQGGIIYNEGTLVLKDTEISGGEAVLGGGIYNAGGATLTLESGSVNNNKAISPIVGAGRAGGVFNAQNATFNLVGGSVRDNTCDYYGAGILNDKNATLTISGGSVENNIATTINGIDAKSHGGGVFNSGTFTMSNGLIKGNKAGEDGGGMTNNEAASFTMTGGTIEGNSLTLASNGGGGLMIYKSAFKMQGGTIKGNTARTGAGVSLFIGSSFDFSGGIIEGNTATVKGGGVSVHTNSTMKMTGGTISGNTALENGGGILNSTNSTLTMSGGKIEGNTATNYGGGVLSIADSTLIMSGGNVEGNSVGYSGAGIFNDTKGTFTFSGGTIQNNISTGTVDPQNSFGGGVYNNGMFTMSNGTIKGNKVTRAGAGVYNEEGATFTMTDGIIEANKTTGTVDNGGGGVLNYLGTFKMSGGTIQDNTSMYAGGVNNWGTFEMTGGTVKNNTAANGAGGVGNTRAAAIFKLIQGIISGNTGAYGGGIKNTGSFTMTGGTVSGNTATQDGAGIHNSDGGSGITAVTAVIQSGVIENNTATRNGGGIMNYKAGITISGGTIQGNSAVQGAGLWTGGDTTIPGSATLTGGTISSNTASQSGGGVFRNVNGAFSNTGSTVSSNLPNDISPTP